MVRGRSFSRNHEKSKSRTDFKDMKKNQCVFYKEIGHWKVDCLKIKDKESKPKANLTQMVNTQDGGTHR